MVFLVVVDGLLGSGHGSGSGDNSRSSACLGRLGWSCRCFKPTTHVPHSLTRGISKSATYLEQPRLAS